MTDPLLTPLATLGYDLAQPDRDGTAHPVPVSLYGEVQSHCLVEGLHQRVRNQTHLGADACKCHGSHLLGLGFRIAGK